MSKIKSYFLFVCALFSMIPISAMVYDNRFIPLLPRPRLMVDGKQSSFGIDFFMATGSKALGRSEDEIGIPELFGKFDLGQLARAAVCADIPNALRSEWLAHEIPYDVEGKIQAQAVAFSIHHPLTHWLAVGANWLCMRVNSSQEFILNCPNLNLTAADEVELDQERRKLFSNIGLKKNHAAQIGFGDVDCYLYFGYMRDYMLKFRRIDLGARLGVLMPSGLSREINSPASIPFGGNGHWGAYAEFDGLFELREDLKAGLIVRLSKRFARTSCQRIPVKGEPYIFGATTGQVDINPGVTFVFSPYVSIENLRQGLGLGVQYCLTAHSEDKWRDARSNSAAVPVDLCGIDERSAWGSDYFSLNVFYDFGKEKITRSFDPILSFRWDVPAMLFVSKRFSKTHRVSVGVEFAF